ncbi:3-hydroxyacyl-[acyl-carrier-protein] dehydratase FabZ [Arenicella chitinivorans]|uniref:3-hydroxyacyl-[acyl-carrier-protein] dehydratase FabZ n=1 Tax=Arenicella chitinivorans TaxID=1329800 RepID=A0A918RKW2_9GAMM|nr:3-hydroxyacyl-[acyl-carrier-protein] dehydratase FabZ [Arenicella chitinivorans]
MALLDIHQIRNYLPHRYPFLLVDRVLEAVPEERLVALKNVTYNEPFFTGHFPGRPVMPGVLIVEALAQAAALTASYGREDIDTQNRVYYFTGIDKARFKQPVEPGDQLILEVDILRRIKNMWKCKGVATVDGKVAASAEMMFTFKDIV